MLQQLISNSLKLWGLAYFWKRPSVTSVAEAQCTNVRGRLLIKTIIISFTTGGTVRCSKRFSLNRRFYRPAAAACWSCTFAVFSYSLAE